jgi:HEAT repeat protein
MENEATGRNAVKALVQEFGSLDPAQRMKARDELVALDDLAVDELANAFQDDRRQVRWEAANCLRMIGSVKAIPALILQIEDDDSDVGWLAAEALIAAGEKSLIPLLESLTSNKHADLGLLYNHAHHVIRSFASSEKYQLALQPLLNAFDETEPQIGVPVKAYEAKQLLG